MSIWASGNRRHIGHPGFTCELSTAKGIIMDIRGIAKAVTCKGGGRYKTPLNTNSFVASLTARSCWKYHCHGQFD